LVACAESCDGRAGDAWLATLKVTDGGLIVILVVSGNAEFGTGRRRELLDFLDKRLSELKLRFKSQSRQ